MVLVYLPVHKMVIYSGKNCPESKKTGMGSQKNPRVISNNYKESAEK
jgi:hypothetical protein